MAPESFATGTQVVHLKMQIIGTVTKVSGDLVYVQIAENKPVQVWNKDELTVWDARGEIQEKLKQGGYIRDIFKKFLN